MSKRRDRERQRSQEEYDRNKRRALWNPFINVDTEHRRFRPVRHYPEWRGDDSWSDVGV
ncbi:hypothetical protein KAJ38_02410 [Candidatus Pacearchaeota archaeon]|nr:hypothetical protein [Candidatus Pacearchaeota archaeon]